MFIARRTPFVALFAGLALSPLQSARAQRTAPLVADTYLLKDSAGTQLIRILKGTPVVLGRTQGRWITATIDGWIAASALATDTHDGFELGVTDHDGTTMRDRAGAGTALAAVRFGVLFNKLGEQDGWVRVKRTGWLPRSAVTAVAAKPAAAKPAATKSPSAPTTASNAAPANKTTATPPPSPPPATGVGTAPATDSAVARTSVIAGTGVSLDQGGAPVATLELPIPVEVLGHSGGWAHVRIDAWVRDASLSHAPPSGITAADLRADPDKYVGQTVEWTVELIAVETADELRPELTAGQPFLLVRGPLPENGFVYVAVTPEEADTFRALAPLTRIRIRATVRAGRSRFLPTPVLTFLRRLD